MLNILVPGGEKYDELHNEFIYSKPQLLTLEHSLVSLSKWESKWKKPFLADNDKTTEELLDYIKCMNITQNVPPEVWKMLTRENIKQVTDYINDSMTATWFAEDKNKKKGRDIITAEIIYYWMISCQIPFECQKWHLNRLLTLIRVCNEKNKPPKKMSKRELLSRNRALNEARLKQMGSNG